MLRCENCFLGLKRLECFRRVGMYSLSETNFDGEKEKLVGVL